MRKITFAKKLKQFRERMGMSQVDLARTLGISYQTYNGYETKGNEPKYDLLVKIAKTLNVTPNDLLCNEEMDFEQAREIVKRAGIYVEKAPKGLQWWKKEEEERERVVLSLQPIEFCEESGPFSLSSGSFTTINMDYFIETVKKVIKIIDKERDAMISEGIIFAFKKFTLWQKNNLKKE